MGSMSTASDMVADLCSAPCEDFRQSARDMRAAAEHLIAEGWTKPRRVTTAAELDALAVGSVVLNDRGDAWRRGGRNWYLAGADGGRKDVPYPPFTVLHEPGEGQ